MSEGTIAKAKAILDGSARGTDCKDVARAYVELDQSLSETRVVLAVLARDHEAAVANLTQVQTRCTELLEEVRALRAGRSAHVAAGPLGTLTPDEPFGVEAGGGQVMERPIAATETAQGATFGPGTPSGPSGETSARPEAAQVDRPVRVSEWWAWSTYPAERIVQVDRGRRQAVTHCGTLMTLREDGRPGDACWRRVP